MIETTRSQNGVRWLLGGFLIFAGLAHLTFARAEFAAQVPPWVPLDTDLVIVLSGIVEILLGASLLGLRKYRVWVGCATAAFFVAVFPGNISQYVNSVDAFGLNSDSSRLIRLFFQPVLILAVLWSTGTWWRRTRPTEAKGEAG